jgi:AbrB family looped-hinge helix DNA binding protein
MPYSLLSGRVRSVVETSAIVTSKGQVTIPARVRAALGIRRGARLLFRVEDDHIVVEEPVSGRRAIVSRLPDFFRLAGSVPVPDELRGASWPAIRDRAREQRAVRRR